MLASSDSNGNGYLYQADLLTMVINPTPVATFQGPARDVAAAGPYVAVLVDTGQADLQYFDFGNPAQPLSIGVLPADVAVPPEGGLSLWIDPDAIAGGASLDDAVAMYVSVNDTVTVESTSNRPEDMAYTILTGPLDDFDSQSYSEGVALQASACESGCPPVRDGNGGTENLSQSATTGNSVHYASGEETFTLPLVSVPGVGLDLDLDLTYRSRRLYNGRYGQS